MGPVKVSRQTARGGVFTLRRSPCPPATMLYAPPPPSPAIQAPVLHATSARAPAAARPALAPPSPAPVGEVAGQPGQALMLMPGQLHFSNRVASLSTLLGSCVAITLWHPVRRLGGMCHYLLPSRKRTADQRLDGRYGDEAVERLLALLTQLGTRPQEYVAHLYGGADAMPDSSGVKFNVGERNIEMGWQLIDRCGFQLEGVDVGDQVPRSVRLVLANGEVAVRRGGALI